MGEGSKSTTIASARLHGITADSSFTARNLYGDIVRLLGDPLGCQGTGATANSGHVPDMS